MKDILEEMLKKLNKDEMIELAVVLWKIWRRNEFIFKGNVISPNSVMFLVKQLLQELKLSETKVTINQIPSNSVVTIWERPPPGFYKINWDVGVDTIHCKIGIGVVVTDEEANILATMRKRQDLFPDPLTAEAYAALKVSIFGFELGLRKIILEGDSKKVVMAVQNQSLDDTYFGMLISDIRAKMHCYEESSINHIKREGNLVAHALGKNALNVDECIVKIDSVKCLCYREVY
ncbi:hypothetical protein F2P56_012920 [Juglans regia]|uniref:RNase H type-1 domain-containing protein n=2 Tax=Juglans regia TaxID=51240 RepID=A0A834CXP7_JUGRE|nr:uncharacterized protein LOC109000548 [Juglans regia]KAF5468800.1 hypothetical protein F2P56_012920 [Juglans regia]